MNKKARMGSHKNHLKGPGKRTEEADKRFAQSFEKLVLMACTQEGEHNGIKKCNDTKKAERFFKERGMKYPFIDMKEKGMSKGAFTFVA